MARNYKKYVVYQIGYKLAIDLYKITDKFPSHEQNNLIGQIRRAATSIPVNIAEGSAKKSPKEFLYFLNVAYGSAKELAVLIDLSKDIGYIKEDLYNIISDQVDNFNSKIFLFIRHIEKEHCSGPSFFQKYKEKITKDSGLI
ncbi:MAG: four helix bundle protein [Nanoarchaeota archaeon]|nr:four helix bundle protein [Nanoarchaeota archaeon]MBU1005041.1 four helix bundle protein [Nanoarchaeota archaeon]MBU1946458.1 four helix bundle protein [Nanoarchaeota archaeon]